MAYFALVDLEIRAIIKYFNSILNQLTFCGGGLYVLAGDGYGLTGAINVSDIKIMF
jgi:hypothetical protein